MAKSVGRNDPCPCGSGLKYKKCHWSQDKSIPTTASGEPLSSENSGNIGFLSRKQIALLLLALVLGAGVVLLVMGFIKWAVAVAGAGSIVVLIVWVTLDPPPVTKDKGNPSGLNFGG